jgi:uncharacterized protein YqfA (UPF0365 family)
MNTRARIILLVLGGIIAGGATGAGVGLELYGPALAATVAIGIGLVIGFGVRRALRQSKS